MHFYINFPEVLKKKRFEMCLESMENVIMDILFR